MVTAAICMPVGLLQAELCWGTLDTIGSLNKMDITNQVGVGSAGGQMPGHEHIRISYVLGARFCHNQSWR